MEYRENPTRVEPGASIYLVPNKHGSGKTAVRRPHPPPTSPPLDDDFDAASQAGTTRGTRGIIPRYQGTKLSARPPSTSSTVPRVSKVAAEYHKIPRRRLRTSTRAPRPQSSDSSYGSVSVLGNPEGSPKESYDNGDHETYTERAFGQDEGQTQKISVTTVRPDERYALGRETRKTERKVPNSAGRGRRCDDGMGQRLGHKKRTMEGPPRGQDYRMIDRRIIEDGPERTVTVSTWREEVARRASSEMSVYYVNPEDYVTSPSAMKVEGRAKSKKKELFRHDREDWSSDSPDMSNQGDHARRKQVFTGRPLLKVELEKVDSRRGVGYYQPRSAPLPEARSNPPFSPLDRVKSPTNASISTRGKQRSSNAARGSHETIDAPRIDATIPEQAHTSNSSRTPPRTSTPTKGRLPPPSFHPTSSGSSISSFNEISTASFKIILSSCRPSLLHLMPALLRLGIRTEEHLRAIANMNEDTRDREVKEEALRNGVTIMEWAILLDRLRRL